MRVLRIEVGAAELKRLRREPPELYTLSPKTVEEYREDLNARCPDFTRVTFSHDNFPRVPIDFEGVEKKDDGTFIVRLGDISLNRNI